MPWIVAGNAPVSRGNSFIISLGVPAPSPYIIEHAFPSPFPIGYWGTLYIEQNDILGSPPAVPYTYFSLNLYTRRHRFDIPAAAGPNCNVRIRIGSNAAESSYNLQAWRFV